MVYMPELEYARHDSLDVLYKMIETLEARVADLERRLEALPSPPEKE